MTLVEECHIWRKIFSSPGAFVRGGGGGGGGGGVGIEVWG